MALTLTIILLGVPARPQSIPSSEVSAHDLAQRVVTNELDFQEHHTNWMYRLEKEQYGKKQVEEIVETNEGSLSRLLSINDRPLSAKQQVEEDERVRLLMNSRNALQKLRRALDAETLLRETVVQDAP
jgi:16S rRNA C967 or C1407 C5-methylase (RsmB/RsmF family)